MPQATLAAQTRSCLRRSLVRWPEALTIPSSVWFDVAVAHHPATPNAETRAQAREFAIVLTRRLRWRLWALTALSIVGGLIGCLYKGDAEPLARAGAVITVLTFGHAFAVLRWNETASDAVHRDPVFATAVQRRFTIDHLLVGAIGTLVWGFGDLLPLAWLRAW